MGVGDDALWEVQWHSWKGRAVRRLVLTRRGLRRSVWALAVVVVIMVSLVSLFPVALKGLFSSFTVEAARRENRARQVQTAELQEQLARVLDVLAASVQRARRLAWATRAPDNMWRRALQPRPPVDGDDEALATWLEVVLSHLDALESSLDPARVSPPCGMRSLPLTSPLGPERAVPVALFGWRVSPFTGTQMANHGVVWASQLGEPVLAPGGGTVLYAGAPRETRANEWSKFGTIVVLDHGKGVHTVYGHLASTSVRRGQVVARGERLGFVGQTGWTKVPALYYEIRWPLGETSKPVDPALVSVNLRVEDLDGRLADPVGGLPDDYALIEHLGGVQPSRS